MKAYKKVKKFFHKRMVVQLRQKDLCKFLDVTMTELREALSTLEDQGHIYVEKNHGKSNRYHYLYKG